MKTFEEIRLKFRKAVLTVLCDIHHILYDSNYDSVNNLEVKLIKLEPDILFYLKKDTTQPLLDLVPIVDEVIKECSEQKLDNNNDMLYCILLMLYSGYVSCEQVIDFIPDMGIVLRHVLGNEKAKEAYNHIIHIASSECNSCSKLRKFFLFGTKIYN